MTNPSNIAMGMMPPPAGGMPPAPSDAGALLMKVAGATHGGAVPMVKGGSIHDLYPNLRAMSHVAWRQVNPRLMEVLQKLGEKHQFTVVLQKGYVDHRENAAINGHPTSTHKRGISVDAFVAGHPLGEVVSPDELHKLGLAVGGPNGDPAHVELAGIPLKQPKGATDGTAQGGGSDQGSGGAGGLDVSGGGGQPGPPGLGLPGLQP